MNQYEGPSGGEYAAMEVDFSGDDGKKRKAELASYLKRVFDEALDERAGLEQKWKHWADQANARLKRPDAGPYDSNIDMPTTGVRLLQVKSRLANPIFQQDQLFICKPRRPRFDDQAQQLEKTIDYIVDRVAFMELCDDSLDQGLTFSCCVVKTPWVTRQEKIKRWQKVGVEEFEILREAGYDGAVIDSSGEYLIEEDYTYDAQQGAFPEVIPVEDFVFAPGAASVKTAAWVCHRNWLTKSDLNARVREGIYSKDAVKGLSDPSATRERMIPSREMGGEEEVVEPEGKQYEILEFYLSYDVDGDDEEEEIIAVLERSTGTLLRVVHNFYHAYRRPFVTWTYKRRLGSIYGDPLTFQLEPAHRAKSASINQRLDAAIKANEIILIGRPGSELRKIFENGKLRGGYYETNGEPSELKEFKLSQPFTQLPELEQKFEEAADMLSSLSPYSFALEQIQRPTATGQVQLIEEGKQPLYMLLESYRKFLAEIVLHMLARYRQFHPAGMEIYDMATEGDSQVLVEWPIEAFEEAVFVETSVSSQNMSKNVRKQELLAFVDKIPQIYQTYMGMAQMALQPSPVAPFAAALLNGYQVVVDRWLSEFEIAKQEAVNPQSDWLVQIGQQIAQLQQQMAAVAQENQMLKAQMAQGPIPQPVGPGGPAMGPPPGGQMPPGPPGPFGGPTG